MGGFLIFTAVPRRRNRSKELPGNQLNSGDGKGN